MFGLLRYFSIASAVALIAVTFALVYLYRDNAMEELVVSAEGQNVTLARSFANILWPRFSDYVTTVTDTDGDKLRARPETAEIDEAVRALTAGLPVLKVKIYNLDGRTIYSSQPSQIGADKGDNPGFQKSARAGKPASKYTFRENFGAFSGTVMNRDLVESYLPIWGEDDAIEGVFELYTDVTPLMAMIDRRSDRLTAGLLITFALLYGFLFLIVRRADRILKRQYSGQLEYRGQIEEKNTSLEQQIDERQRAEEALRESQERLAGILDIADDAVISINGCHRIILFNKGAEQIFGYGAQEILGESIDVLLPLEFRKNHRAQIKNFTEGSKAARTMGERSAIFGRRKDGTEFPGEASISKLDLNGSQIFTVILRDVTQRIRAEETLARQSVLLEATFETMNQGIIVNDADHRLVAFNQKFVDLFDFPPGFVRIGMAGEEIVRFLAERGEYGPGDVEELVRERVRDRDRGEINPRERTRPNGTVISARRDPMPDGGYVTTYTDITMRKRAEEAVRESEARFRAVVDNSPTKIHIKDAEGRYTLVNPVAETLFGFTDEEARGKTSYDIFPKQVADAFTAHDRQVADSGEMVEEVEQFTVEDRVRTYLTVKFPIPDGRGGVAGVAAIGTDITERKGAEEALRESEKRLRQHITELQAAKRQYQAQGKELVTLAEDLAVARDQAEDSNRAKSDFLALMSHELRTPLNAIIGFSEIIKSEMMGPIGNPKYGEYAGDVFDSGQHLLGLINDILDLSKIEAGKMEFDEDDVDVAEVIGSCLKLLSERAAKGGVKLATEVPDDLPALRCDGRKLKQILLNLLSNAVKFTPEGGSVTVKTWFRPESGFVLQVADTGVGIALGDIPKALTPFGQVDSRLDRKYEGTGLGLSLTKSLVEKHSGSLDLQSEVGVGTTVTVRFPPERMVPRIEVAATGYPAA